MLLKKMISFNYQQEKMSVIKKEKKKDEKRNKILLLHACSVAPCSANIFSFLNRSLESAFSTLHVPHIFVQPVLRFDF